MIQFIFGLLMLGGGLLAWVVTRGIIKPWMRNVILFVLTVGGIATVIFSGTLWVSTISGGLITKKFGDPLKDGHVIAANGERGVQAEVLPQGWTFPKWYAPWQYDLESVPNQVVPPGQVGVVTALDGKPLPEGEVYAPAWEDPTAMLDGTKFMQTGYKGPQLTVLTPGQYRYNPKLFQITLAPVVDIVVGEVGVVRANAGLTATNNAIDVNGVPLVPKGYKGIWNDTLAPGQYYMHPTAYQVVKVKTLKRVYSYTHSKGSDANTASAKEPEGDNSIPVRSLDSFQFPVEVRVAVAILAQNAPYVVAKLGDPDSDLDRNGFELIEDRAILPSLRAILRNSAESKKAIEYVNSRSKVEADGLKMFTLDMAKDKIEVEGFFLANINLGATPEGTALLKTQTDKELAVQQQEMYQNQVTAETERGKQVEAAAKADMQKEIQKSLAGIEVAKNEAEAAKKKAEGEAAQSLVYEAKIKAFGGTEAFTRLEITKLLVEKLAAVVPDLKPGVFPQVFVSGGSGGDGSALTGLTTSLLAQMQAVSKATPVVEAPKPAQQ